MQRQLWASQRRNPESPHQNTALLSTIEGSVDFTRLAAAFAQVVATSDVLRTRIDGDVVRFGNPFGGGTPAALQGNIHEIRIYNASLSESDLTTAFST